MFGKLVIKTLLKLTLSIGCMVGLMSYGMHLRGGDPGALLAKMSGGVFAGVKSSVQNAGNSLKSASPVKSKTTVYQWSDANGVTQFGSTPPDGVVSQAKTYDNNANLMAAQKPIQATPSDNYAEGQPGVGPEGEPLPGVAGMNLPTGGDPAQIKAFLQTLQQQE